MRMFLKGLDRPQVIEDVISEFGAKHPLVLQQQVSGIYVGRVIGPNVAQATVGGRIQIDVARFNEFDVGQSHIIAHELYHQAMYWMVSKARRVVFDLADGEAIKVSNRAAVDDQELYAEIGAFGLLGASDPLIRYNYGLICAELD